MAIERAKYRVYNGTEFDEIRYVTDADLVEIKDTAGKFTATEVEGALKENADKIGNLNGIIGSLSSLVTTVKTSIVNAINEIKNELTSHKNNKNNPHNVTAAQVGAALSSHSHTAGDLPSASTSAKGIVQLSTSTSSTSTTLAATASAVRTVNNNLSNKVDKPSSATSGNIAVFDGGAGKIKDGGKTIQQVSAPYYATGIATLSFTALTTEEWSAPQYVSTGCSCVDVFIVGNQAGFTFQLTPGNKAMSIIQISIDDTNFRYEYISNPKYTNDILLASSTYNAVAGQLLSDGRLRIVAKKTTSGYNSVNITLLWRGWN